MPIAIAIAWGFVTFVSAENNDRTGGMPGRLINVADTKLHLYCQGHGPLTVMLEAGLGGNYLDWTFVQPMLAEQVTVCAYDRAGV